MTAQRELYARVRRDDIAYWAEVVERRGGLWGDVVVKSESCLWAWSARFWAPRLLKKAQRRRLYTEKVS